MKNIIIIFLLVGPFLLDSTYGQVNWTTFNTNLGLAHRDSGGSGDTGGGGSATTDRGGSRPIGGGGENEFVIATNLPSSGTLIKSPTLISWQKLGTSPYTLTIKLGRTEIYKATVATTKCEVDFGDLAVTESDDYSISIVDAKNKYKTNDIEVNFVEKSMLDQSLQVLENDASYKSASGIEKDLMKAYFLEQQGYILEAAKSYDIPTTNVEDMKMVLAMFTQFSERN